MGQQDDLDQGSAKYRPQAKYRLPLVPVNTVLLEDSHMHLFIYCLSLLAATADEWL